MRALDREIVPFTRARDALAAAKRPGFPSLVLMDMSLPGEEAAPAISALRARGASVVALTSHERADFVFSALRAGAVGYVLKRDVSGALEGVLAIVEAGGSPITPSVARRVLDTFLEPGTTFEPLSARERQIVRLFADGRTYGEAAAALGISIDTVREHVRRLYDKLRVRTRSEAVVAALRRGLIG